MAFRLRRGTDAERLIITPEEGELIYTTDSKKIFVGDGTTLGGNAVDTTSLINLESELGNLSIDSFGDVNSDSTVPSDGDILAYDAGTGDWRAQAQSGGGGATAISDLTDVDTTGLLNDDVLVYNSVSGNFERATFRLEALRDVNFTNLTNSVLVYDNVAGTFNQTQSLNNNIVDADDNVILNVFSSLFTGDMQGNILAEDSSVVVSIGADASDSTVTANLVGNVDGDLTGDVLAANGASVLDPGTDGTDATFTGAVTGNVIGNLTGNVTGTLDGDLTGSVFADDSSIIIDGLNGDGHFSSIISTDAQLNIGRTTGITEVRIESFQTRNRFNINTVDKTGDLSSYTGYYGTLNFGFEDATTDRSDCTIRGRASDMRIAHDTVTTLIDDETKYFTLKEGNFGFGTYTPAEKLDVRGNIVATGTIQPGVYADATARDAALTSPTAGQMVFITDVAKFQGNTDGTITGWVNLN